MGSRHPHARAHDSSEAGRRAVKEPSDAWGSTLHSGYLFSLHTKQGWLPGNSGPVPDRRRGAMPSPSRLHIPAESCAGTSQQAKLMHALGLVPAVDSRRLDALGLHQEVRICSVR